MLLQNRPARLGVLLGSLLVSACSNNGDDENGEELPPGTAPEDDPSSEYRGICVDRDKELDEALCPGDGESCDAGCDFYLAADGDDENDGKSADAAWKSLSKVSENATADGGTFCLRRGDVFTGEIILEDRLHASADSPLQIQSFGEREAAAPIVSGAKQLPAQWEASSLGGGIQQIDLSSVLSQGEPYQREGKEYREHEKIYQLFIDGGIQVLARFPNLGEGESTIDGGVPLSAGNYSIIDEVLGGGSYRDDALDFGDDWSGAALAYRSNRWTIRYDSVASSDSSAGTFSTNQELSCAYGECLEYGYMLLDHIDALDAPGEWFYDAESQTLHMLPPEGVDLNEAKLEVSLYRQDVEPPDWANESDPPLRLWTHGVDLKQASGVNIRGLTFQHYSGAGVTGSSTISEDSADKAESTSRVKIEGNEFLHTGSAGVRLEKWGDIASASGASLVSGNQFTGQLSQAVIARITESEISCNDVEDIGLISHYPRFGMGGSGVNVQDHGMAVMASGAGLKVLYNRFQRTASSAISFRNPDATIAFNFIEEACYTKADCGGVHSYSWDDGFLEESIQGSVLSHNIVLHTYGGDEGCGGGDKGALAQGLFLDLGSQSYSAISNVVADSTSAGFLLQSNRAVRIEDNLLYANNRVNPVAWQNAQLMIISESGTSTDADIVGNTFFAASPMQKTFGIREESVSDVAAFSGNRYYDPFAYDCEADNGHYGQYLMFENVGDEVTKFHAREWRSRTGEEDAQTLSFYWPQVKTEAQGDELMENGSFDDGTQGWSVNDWAGDTLSAGEHPDLGAALKFESGDSGGGGHDVISPALAVEAGKTYEIRFWIAPEPGSESVDPPILRIGETTSYLVPLDGTRQVSFIYEAQESQSDFRLLFGAYPYFPQVFWLDDVSVREVSVDDYVDSAVSRFDQELPDARSVLVYNDTDEDQSVELSAVFFSPDGSKYEGTADVPSFGAVILIPEAWSKSPVK